MASNQYIDIRVTGFAPDLRQFLRGLMYIQACCSAGAHRTIAFNVDGDGSANLHFEDLNGNVDFGMVRARDIPEPPDAKMVDVEVEIHVGE